MSFGFELHLAKRIIIIFPKLIFLDIDHGKHINTIKYYLLQITLNNITKHII